MSGDHNNYQKDTSYLDTTFSATKTVMHNEETDDYYIEFTDEEMDQLDWTVGDKINWKSQDDGSFVLSKIGTTDE